MTLITFGASGFSDVWKLSKEFEVDFVLLREFKVEWQFKDFTCHIIGL